jgi:hypothetical protein
VNLAAVILSTFFTPLIISGPASGQPVPAAPRVILRPAEQTVIRAAPPELCKLLDVPAKRQLMDGLLFNLLWSCGRQKELGVGPGQLKSVAEESAEEEGIDQIVAKAFTVTDVQVNNSAGESGASATQNETSLVQSPVTGTLCSSFNDSWHFYGSGGGFTGFARSTDGGRTWVDGGAVGAVSEGDPSLVWRRSDGNFYLATLQSGGSLALWVSTNDCQTFSFLSTPSTGGDDKEILAVDNNPASPNYGNLYLVWTDFGVAGSPIRATRSTDGGVTWWAPVTVSTGGVVQGAWPAVAPNGDVFVAWLQYTDFQNGPISINVSRSTNGGLSYAAVTSPLVNAVSPRHATASASCGRPALNGNIRYLASPQIAVDASGVLHVVYSYDSDGFNVGDVVNVYYRRSTNSGATWSTELRLNDDATQRDQYFPSIQVTGSTVMAGWYDRRLDASNLLQDYFKRVSTDGGVTWAPSVRVSDVSSPVRFDPGTAGCYHGDYDQSVVTVTNGEVVQWADDRNVLSGHNDADVWNDPATETYRCVIDINGGTSTCTGAVTLQVSSGIYRVGRIDLASGFQRMDVFADICNPTGYTIHVADSPTTNGFGGDGGTTNHDAETHLTDTSFNMFDDDLGNLGAVERNAVAASGCYRVQYSIMENTVLFDNDGNPADAAKINVDSYEGFELGPYAEADAEDPGAADANLWYLGLNRTVGDPSRSGTGVSRACVVLSRTTTPDTGLLSRLCP